jgi:hypothetical protein
LLSFCSLQVLLHQLCPLNLTNSVAIVLWYAGRARPDGDYGKIRLPDNEASKLMTDHVPASLHFSNLTYTLGSRTILDSISGSVKPGQVMAIMGASGAGKSTFLDILARKRKKGIVSGTTLVNGREVPNAQFKKVMGFVDQEDTLMRTLTVYETVLYSALLRLPREMSLDAKKFRTLETMNELGILGIKDSRIGDSGEYTVRRQDTRLELYFLLQEGDQSQGEKSGECLSPASLSQVLQSCSWMSPPAVRVFNRLH